MRGRNRWHVYEALKQAYMASGEVPNMQTVMQEFKGDTEFGEIEEGIGEFVATIRCFVPEIEREQVVGE